MKKHLTKVLALLAIATMVGACSDNLEPAAPTAKEEIPAAAAPAAPAGEVDPDAMKSAHPTPTAGAIDLTGITKAEGGYTVEELFLKKDELAGKEIALRAKVVKFTGGVMGTNWLHLQDGTGSGKTADLTATSPNPAAVGDTVLVKGALQKDYDIGSGYFFEVILKDAAVTVEK
jgi:hypothetical protein